MLGWEKLASCVAALVLLTALQTRSFAQARYEPSRPHPQHADGQWHRFQKQAAPHPSPSHSSPNRPSPSRPSPSRPSEARPPQNLPGHAGNWLRRYKDLPPAQQRRALENDPQFRKLPPQQQARLQNRLQHFSSLPPQQQERVLNRMETWEHLTPEQKQQGRQLFQQFKQLPNDRRQAVNRAIRDMRGLSPEQRDQLINSDQYRNSFSLQERVILSGAAHLPLAPGDGLQAAPPE